MTVLAIKEWPEKVLETKAAPVTVFDAELKQFVADMHATMDQAGGIGLAANQVGVLQRVLTIYIPFHEPKGEPGDEGDAESGEEEKQWWHDKRFTLINPVITQKKGKARYMEGCLSFPEIYDFVDRAEHIQVTAQDQEGKTLTFEAAGLFAICIQHEIDHLDGIVFINRMSRLKSQMIKKKIQKRLMLNAQPEKIEALKV